MSEEKCTPKQTPVCDEKVLKEATDKGQCDDIDVCLPFGGRLYTNGGCLAYEQGTAPEDGTYGKIKVQNGCIVGVEEDDATQYAATPCAPVPNPCDCDGGVNISGVQGNLLFKDGSGDLAAVLYYEAGNGIEMSGDGTAENPLTVSATGGGGGGVSSVLGNGVIEVTTSNNSAIVKHKQSVAGSGTIGSVKIDSYGHVIGAAEVSTDSGVKAVLGGDGINAVTDPNTNIVTVSLGDMLDAPSGTWWLGGYLVDIDSKGRVTGVRQEIRTNNRTYTLGDYDVTLNGLGSITEITPNSDSGGGGDTSGAGLSPAGVMFSYIWYSAGTDIEVAFKLAKKSHVRLLFTPNANNAPGGLSVDVDGTLDFDRYMDYLGGMAIYSRTKIDAGSHVMHISATNTSGGSDSFGGTFDIQAFTLGTVTGGES